MKFEKNVALKPYHTFGINCHAKHFVTIKNEAAIESLLNTSIFQSERSMILGGGSNILFTKDYDGLIIKNNLKGKTIIEEDENQVLLKIASGENWHETVTYCVEKNWYGIENLALIPGSVGASPIQNIGAYGVELKDVFHSVRFYHLETKQFETFYKKDMSFGYRDSIFKKSLKGKVFITEVTLQLQKKADVKTSYGAIQQTLKEKNILEPTIRDVYEAVIAIRSRKLPNPKEIGNAGSFFKNPTLPNSEAQTILANHPNAPHYIVDEENIKIPAGWMIEKCGWKGYKEGDIGVHDKQALVLVNTNNGKGEDLKKLAYKIQASVQEKFGVLLEPEVNMV